MLTCSPAIVTEIHSDDCVNLGIIRNHSTSIDPVTSVVRGSLPGNFQLSDCVDRVPADSEPCEEAASEGGDGKVAPLGEEEKAGSTDL